MISSAWLFISPADGRHGAAHAEHAGAAVLRLAASRNRAGDGRRPSRNPRRSAPRRRQSSAKRQSLSRSHSPILVRGDVADVVDVEEQQRAALANSSAPGARAPRR